MADQQQHDDTNVDLDDIPLTALHGKVVIITGAPNIPIMCSATWPLHLLTNPTHTRQAAPPASASRRRASSPPTARTSSSATSPRRPLPSQAPPSSAPTCASGPSWSHFSRRLSRGTDASTSSLLMPVRRPSCSSLTCRCCELACGDAGQPDEVDRRMRRLTGRACRAWCASRDTAKGGLHALGARRRRASARADGRDAARQPARLHQHRGAGAALHAATHRSVTSNSPGANSLCSAQQP